MNQNIESICIRSNTTFNNILKNLSGQNQRVRGIRPYKIIEKSIARKQIGSKMEAFHLVEDLKSELRLLRDNVSSKGSVKYGFRNGVIGVKEVGMKRMMGVIKMCLYSEPFEEGNQGCWVRVKGFP